MRDYGRMSHFLEPKSKMSSIVNFDQELADLLQVEERLLFIFGGHIVYYLIWRFCCLMLESEEEDPAPEGNQGHPV